MAVVAVTFIGVKVLSFDTYTDGNWLDEVGTYSGAANTDIQIEGTQCVSDQVSASTKATYDITAADWLDEPWDFSATGADFGSHIYVWLNILGTPAALSAGGFRILAADDLATDSRGTWYVGPQAGWTGGWNSFVANPSQAFDTVTAGTGVWTTTGNPAQLTGVDGFGFGWSVSSTFMGANDNCFVDAISVGTGYRLTGGDGADTDGKFSDFITYEETSTNRYGALRSASGVLLAKGKLRIGGTGAENTVFTDSGFTVVWEGVLNSAGRLGVAESLYSLNVDRGSGSTTLSLSNGSLSAASPAEVYIDFAGATTVTLDNLTLVRARLIDLDSNVSWTGGTIIDSGMMDLGGTPTLTNINFIDPTDQYILRVDAPSELNNVNNLSFDGAGVGGRRSGAIAITNRAGGSYDLRNIQFANRITGSADVVITPDVRSFVTLNVLDNGDTPTVFQDYITDIIPGPPPGAAEYAAHGTNWESTSDELFTFTGPGYVVNNSVSLTISNVVVGSNVAIITDIGGPEPAGKMLMNTVAASSTVTTSYSYLGTQPVIVRVRRSQSGSTRYYPINTGGTITNTGFSLRIEQIVDSIAAP